MSAGRRAVPEPADLPERLHELRVRQLELEMRNEELESGNRRLAELYDRAPVGHFSVTAAGRIRQLNLMGAELLGKGLGAPQGSMFRDYVARCDRAAFDHFLGKLMTGGETGGCEIELDPPSGNKCLLRITGVPASDQSECRIAAMDLTRRPGEVRPRPGRVEDLDKIFELSPDLIGVAGSDGRFHRVNPAFGRILGYSQDEMTGGCFIHLVHPDDREATVYQMSRIKAGEEVTDFVNRYRCKDGSYRWLEWRATSYHHDVIYAMARDITDRKAAEDALRVSEAKFRSIIESNPTAIYLYQLMGDGRLVLTDSNPAADRATGIDHSSLFGMTAEEAFPSLIGTGVPEKFMEVATGGFSSHSFTLRYDDLRISGVFDVRVFQTGPGMIAVAFQDISERIRAEEELKTAHEELENRVRKRTAQLQARTLQLTSLAREMTQVEERERQRIAALIHDDLQQLLVAALLNLDTLKSRIPDCDGAEDFTRIEGLLRDSIYTTRCLTGELSPSVLQQSDLAPALHWLRTWCMEKYGLDVVVEATEEVDPGPEARVTLFRCVRELLFNIVKHAGVKSAGLKMSCCLDGMLRIVVSDKGAGFEPGAVLAREGTSRGFGLFSIRERLDLLGGGMEIDSAPGCGSRFTLLVPLIAAVRNAPQDDALESIVPQPSSEEGGKGHAGIWRDADRKIRIVVADDHGAVRAGLVRLLESEADFEVVGQAVDGFEALQLARLLRPDAVITDLNMPRMNGLQLAAILHRELPCVKVLGLSIDADAERRTAMIRAGALDLLHKNQPAAQLVARLRSHSASRLAASVP